ncbi:MAG: adenine phosphoribosyltransferase [Arenicellales bacterium]|jgi:adenine phosphoribosyltransferase|nr:adenine phosphoribosyltransferase [Acidiferrobacteraceae bacterium]MDP6139695.1 adenine phosphoribosyltransferase [Arenicellales bacterium]MDP6313671.1 adenine phosphoribosyltransferase [Arenicellales bacterium]MDP7119980.1 adenine phosphoribosyltransferase [Arenicellales bacterium]MDP7193010.1 adenine phosphoribosyltransferase [Arenicellales bacterium]|tara:strand:+ start:3126 stop:3653 length:528 start_codon:yes stop_codon:yes gene_type:complete
MKIRELIRSIPDYPKQGVIFRDITTLLQNPVGFRRAVDELVQPFAGSGIHCVAGIEARGFILGGAVAHQLSVGFIAVRKKGKLPWQTMSVEYELEYGTDEVEIHTDSLHQGERVLIVDDLIATGGTACAAVDLLDKAGGQVVGASFVIDLPDLGGHEKLEAMGVPVRTLVSFAGD